MKVYRSRRSILLGGFLWGVILGSLVIIPINKWAHSPFIITYTFVLAVVSIVWFGIRYKIIGDDLLVLVGPFTFLSIPITSIISLNRSYNPLSSPAASLRRVLLKFRGGEVLISPKNEKAFVQDLKEINSSIYCGINWERENESILTRFVYAIL